MKNINCLDCIYYYITWDYSKPKGCKYFRFKSKIMPSQIVLKNSGDICKAYRKKSTAKTQ